MATALDVLKYMKSAGHPFLGETQAHKLLYYSQAWTLAWDGVALFDEPIRAWEQGPVVRSVRRLDVRRLRAGPSTSLSPQQQANVDAVLRYYGRMSGQALSRLTHREEPWRVTRREHDRSGQPDVIPTDVIRREYVRQSVKGEGPSRQVIEGPEASKDDVLAAASEQADRWRETLAILAL